MPRSRVPLPADVREPFEVYLNGVPQELGRDYAIEAGALVFDRELRKDVSLSRAADLAEQAARIMLADLDEWRLVNQQRDLSVG